MRYYAVTGRISGDDEDTLLLVNGTDHENAVREFKAELRDIRNVSPEDTDLPAYEIYIGAVAWSNTPIFD